VVDRRRRPTTARRRPDVAPNTDDVADDRQSRRLTGLKRSELIAITAFISHLTNRK